MMVTVSGSVNLTLFQFLKYYQINLNLQQDVIVCTVAGDAFMLLSYTQINFFALPGGS